MNRKYEKTDEEETARKTNQVDVFLESSLLLTESWNGLPVSFQCHLIASEDIIGGLTGLLSKIRSRSKTTEAVNFGTN